MDNCEKSLAKIKNTMNAIIDNQHTDKECFNDKINLKEINAICGYIRVGCNLQIQKMKKTFIKLLFITFITTLISCDSKNDHIEINLHKEHLWETKAGFWFKSFDINPLSDVTIKKQMTDILKKDAQLIKQDQRIEGIHHITRWVFEYNGIKVINEVYEGGVWNGPEIKAYQEYPNGYSNWITFELKEPVKYTEILELDSLNIDKVRSRAHTATIVGHLDDEKRLFLFGYADECEKISLY